LPEALFFESRRDGALWLVTAARALMKEGKLPVRDVAKRMSLSVATLYRHVGKRGADDDAAHG
jgi:AcrR family transcriptional regulator